MSSLSFYRWNITFSRPRLSVKVLIGAALVVLATVGFVYVYYYESFNRTNCYYCKKVTTETGLAKGSLRDDRRLSESVATRTRFGDKASTNFDDGRKTNHSQRVASFTTTSLPGRSEASKVAPSPSVPPLRISRFRSSAPTVILPCEEPQAQPVCPGETSRTLRLLVETTAPNNVEVGYSYDVTGGGIKGSGALVTWDLSGVQPGTYKASVRLNNGIETGKSLTVTVSQCPCFRPSPRPTEEPSPRVTPTATATPTPTPVNSNTHVNTNTNTNTNINGNTNANANANANFNVNGNFNFNGNFNIYPNFDMVLNTMSALHSFFEEDYVNQSWPEKLPKNWQSEITVEFRRTYDPKDAPMPSNINGTVSVPTKLPTVLPCGKFSDPKLKDYTASGIVELSDKSDLEVTNPNSELKSLCGESGSQVSWTIPFHFKDYVTTSARFKVIFHVLLKNNVTGKLTWESHELPERTIAVDWLPGTRRLAYLVLLGGFLPTGFGMVFFSGLKTAEEIQDSVLHANLWIEDKRHKLIPLPARLRSGAKYRLLFAIEPRLREMVNSQDFVESSELQNTPVSDLEIQVVSTLLANESGRENRLVEYYAGVGFDPEVFTLTPSTEGTHFITVRVFFKQTILYRERIHVDVEGTARAAMLRT